MGEKKFENFLDSVFSAEIIPQSVYSFNLCTGWTAILATPKKQSPRHGGEFLDSVFFLHPMSGTLFFWGVARIAVHPVVN